MEASTRTPPPIRFGSFELDTRTRELRSGASRTRLQDQPFEILQMMLERPGDVVTREDLRRRLWPEGTFVDFEHSLNAAVKRLRIALGDDAENPRFVETLPRRGYRFIAGLLPEEGRTDRVLGARAPRSRLAVLPFTNLSDTREDYFSDGLTEEMIAQLGGLCRSQFGVIARWSSMVFKGTDLRAREIGEALSADFLLEGSVRGDGDRVRITARLIEASSETQLWSATYDRNLRDCLAVQTEVAAHVARELATELEPGAPILSGVAPNAEAYQAYLKGRYYWNKPGEEGLDQAIAFFEAALASSDAFGAAHAAMASARVSRAVHYSQIPREALEAARRAALRALALDKGLYEAHVALGDAAQMLEWNWTGAEVSYSQAITLNPSYENAHRRYGTMLSSLGRHRDAIRETERACELDPLCLVVGTSAAWVRYAAGDYEAAIQHCRNTIDMHPPFMPAHRLLGAAYLQSGHCELAIMELESAVVLSDDDAVLLSWLAHAKAVTGARTEAARLLARACSLERERYVSSYHVAIGYAGLGQIDRAFDALDTAWIDRDPALANVAVEPRFEPIRTDPRYAVLLGRLRFPVEGVRAS